MIRLRHAAIGGVALIAVAAAPVNPAFAHHRGGPVFGLFALGAAVVTGAAIIATAPIRALAATPGLLPAAGILSTTGLLGAAASTQSR
jgi:hypothetical protein